MPRARARTALLAFVLFVLFVLFVRIAGAASPGAGPPRGDIVGRVVDAESGLPLEAATVSVPGSPFGAVTGADGRFRLSALPVGPCAVEVRRLGYRPAAQADVVVATGHPVSVIFRLTPAPIRTPEVVVPAPLFEPDPESPASVAVLGFEELRRSPGAAEDVSRVMMSLPGVASSSDQVNELVVRGGRPDENLTLWEGIELPNANHFGLMGETGGPISMVDLLMVEETRFYSGAFPARYGDRLSSVLDIRLRDGNRAEVAGNADVSMAGAGLEVEGPFRGRRGAWMLSARQSYLDLIHGSLDLAAIPHYRDAQGKVSFEPGPRDRVSLAAIGGLDEVTIDHRTNDAFTRGAAIDYVRQRSAQFGAGLSWRHTWGRSSASHLALSRTGNSFDLVVREADGSPVFGSDSFEGVTSIATETSFRAGGATAIDVGGAARFPDFDHRLESPGEFIYSADLDSIVLLPGLAVNESRATSKQALFAQATRPLGTRLTLSAGLRYDRFDLPGKGATGPRLSLSWQAAPALRASLAYAEVAQAMPPLYYTQDPSNHGLGYVHARHHVLGLEYLPARDLRFSLEGYAKTYRDQVIAPNDYTRVLENDGRGEVLGFEAFCERKMTRRHFLLLSYSRSRARSHTPSHGWFPSPYDYRSAFTGAWGWTISPTWETSVRWRYAGGKPYTPLLGRVELPNHEWAPVYDDAHPYSARHAPYHRLDLRLGYRSHHPGWNLVTYFEIWNVYQRRNLWGLVWDEKEGATKQAYQFGFFPVGGLRVEF